jgi:histidinol-phosphate phosphatase family protein
MRSTTALVLIGGLGTRLRPAVADLPKALAPVLGRPFVGYLVDRLAKWGYRRAVLCTGYKGDIVERELGDRYAGVDLVYSREDRALGTAGAVRRALPLVETETALVLNGDSVCDVDIDVMAAQHRSERAMATLLLTPGSGRAFGSVDVDERGRVLGFREKVDVAARYVSAGVYLLARDLIATLDPDRPSSLETDVFPSIIGRGLFGFPGGGRLLDIGTPSTYGEAPAFLESIGLLPRRWALLDRDGTILVYHEHLRDPEAVQLIPGAARALRDLRQSGLSIAVVTNQSVIGRGWLDEEGLSRVHRRMLDKLEAEHASVDAILFCPHRPDEGCRCRKPEPGLLAQLAREFPVCPPMSFVVGDDGKDIELGRRVGATTLLVRTGLGRKTESDGTQAADVVVDDLLAASAAIARFLQPG